MNWVEMDIYTTTEGIEAVTGSLLGMGINGFVIKDAKDFQDFLDDKDGNWDYIDDDLMDLKNCETTVTVYLPENAQGLENLEAMKLELKALKKRDVNNEFGRLEYELKNVKEEDWANNWKQYFHPIPVGEKLLIRPTWEEAYDPQGRTVLHLEPGLAFGTGTHETTRLCLELLEKYLKPGMSLLDVGCGSGILSVAGLLLGAEKAVGVDIDALAVKTAGENAQTNGVEEKFQGICGNLTDQVAGKYELVVANIVADIIILLTKDITRYLNPDSIYLMSGIIDTRVQEVRDALEPRFTILEERQEKGWFALAAKQKS